MTTNKFNFLCRLFDKLIKADETDRKVEAIKQEANTQMDAATQTIEKVGRLQRLVMQKTTTYYIAKAVGSLK